MRGRQPPTEPSAGDHRAVGGRPAGGRAAAADQCGGAEAGPCHRGCEHDQEPGDADDHADLARVRRRITGQALADARTALDTEQLPTQLRLTVGRRATRNATKSKRPIRVRYSPTRPHHTTTTTTTKHPPPTGE